MSTQTLTATTGGPLRRLNFSFPPLPLRMFLIAAAFGLASCGKDEVVSGTDLPERINFTASRQYPEGIAWSTDRNRFVVTSLTQGKVGLVGDDGAYSDLVNPPELISAVGVKVAAGRIYVCNSDNGVSTKSTGATAQRIAELLIFDLRSGLLERRVDLDSLLPGVGHFANDVVLASDGSAYVTDSRAPVIYKVSPSGQASILVRDDQRFSAPAFGLNGIVYHPGGYLIVANTGQGKLLKVNLQSGNAVTEVGGISSLPGDGLTLVGNTDLHVVTGSGSRVTQLRSGDNFATATVVKSDEGVYNGATTSTEVNGRIYTLNARIGEIQAAMGNPGALQSNDYSIQRFR